MKSLLLDMNMPVDWIEYLQAEGFTVRRWSSIGDPRADDEVIMKWANANQYIVITQDLDFGTLLALTHTSGPSVVQMRGSLVMPVSSGQFLINTLRNHEQELEQGALVVVDEYRVRVRVLPFS